MTFGMVTWRSVLGQTCSSHDLHLLLVYVLTVWQYGQQHCCQNATALLPKHQVSTLADFLFWVKGRQRTHGKMTSKVYCPLNGRGTTAWHTITWLLLDVDIPETESWGDPAHQHCSAVHQMMLVAAATPTVSCQRQTEPWHPSCDCTVPTYIAMKSPVITLTAEPGLLLWCTSVYVVLTQKSEHKWRSYTPCT